MDLEAAAGHAYMLIQTADTVELETTAVIQDDWSQVRGLHLNLPAGGGELTGAIVLQADAGWLVEGNDRGTRGSARLTGGHWRDWTPPCADVGGTLAYPAASDRSYLAAVCVMGGFASPLSRHAPPGATLGSSWLYVSVNGGVTFSPVIQLGGRELTVGQVLATPAPGDIFVTRSTPQGASRLEASFDGGRHWSIVYDGTVNYLGFTTASQGVAILGEPSNHTAMIMTHDGGHSWARVSF
ncbi:MAG TPA: hypothetical protein VED59_05735 [Acidimicrobiales bacterium]|nr:hypothetical protein [Acidimicrobiales bacterium]